MMIKRLPLSESFAADGFESFSYSQYYPNNINILAGRDSQFLYYSGLSVLRRKGRMTSFQRARRTAMEKSGRADPRATRRSMATIGAELAKLLYDKGICQKDLWTDEHGSYPGAFRQRNRPELFRHHRISSKRARTGRNPLFAVNYLDRQFRKDLSDHARETVQFAHNPACMMSRFVLYRQYHNYLKPFRIKEHNENRAEPCKTHAEAAGLDMAYYRRMVKKYR
ncbi:MAG: hypothetical protein GWN13_31805, partial [Phycisphaerae bacterium]|nr:hypothetical protein [Phycisphaerae bacterium]